jgi:hypothetical protein
MGGKLWFTDNRETPDTLQVTYEYPGFIATYENRNANGNRCSTKAAAFCSTAARRLCTSIAKVTA